MAKRSADCGIPCSCTSIFPPFASISRPAIRIFRGDLTAPRFGLRGRRIRTAGRFDRFGVALRGLAQSQVGEKLPQRKSARHAGGGSIGAPRPGQPRIAALQRSEHRGRGGPAQQRTGGRGRAIDWEPLRLRSLRAHQEILRTHGRRTAGRTCRARSFGPASCWETAAARKPRSSTWCARSSFWQPAGAAVSARATAWTLSRWITWRMPS